MEPWFLYSVRIQFIRLEKGMGRIMSLIYLDLQIKFYQ